MSLTLKEVIESSTTTIQELNTGKRGGTYLQMKCHKVHVPRLPKKDWNCVWNSIEGIVEYRPALYDSFTDEECYSYGELHASNHKIIRLIFREKPFVFLRDVLKCTVKNVVSYDPFIYMMTVCPQVEFGTQTFYDTNAKYKAKPSDEVRRMFAKELAEVLHSRHILWDNSRLIEKHLRSAFPAVKNVAEKFNLVDFYYQKIGDIVEFDKLPWENMSIKATDFASIAFADLPKKQQSARSFEVLTERFQT